METRLEREGFPAIASPRQLGACCAVCLLMAVLTTWNSLDAEPAEERRPIAHSTDAAGALAPIRKDLAVQRGVISDLEGGWRDPPRLARTRSYWWWLNGNVTKEAITRDLEEMRGKGFGGALIFDADGSNQRGNRGVPPGPMFGTEPWRELFVHAVKEADRLGLELGMSIQSGWNLGGPDIVPEETAKQLTWSVVTQEGPGRVESPLPRPRSRFDDYRDIATLAWRVRKTEEEPDLAAQPSASGSQVDYPPELAIDGLEKTFWVSQGREPGEGPTARSPAWLELGFERPVAVVGLRLEGRNRYGPKRCRLLALENGRPPRLLASFDVEDGRPCEKRFEEVRGARFRLECLDAFDPNHPDSPRNVQISELRLRDREGHLIGGRRPKGSIPLSDLSQKAMFRELGGSAPDCRSLLRDTSEPADRWDVKVSGILNLTEKLGANGTLDWIVPEGRWTILRIGYTPTGARVSTSSGDWQGPVLDYLRRSVLDAYWQRHVAPLLDAVEPYCGRTLNFLQTDSWECGGMNWTKGFEEEFRQRRGYDPIPWLAVIAGKIVDSPARSNAFLADFRKTLSDCIADNHYRHFAELAHARGLGIHPESGGPHAGPLDGIKFLGRNDMPMSEFWRESPHRPGPSNRFFVKQAASAAHIYGKRIVCAEGFTSIGPHWNDSFHRDLKTSFDHEICSGLNLTFNHTFTCSPREMGHPGQEYFAGTHFNPNCTWWDQCGAFIGYLNRCQYLMQAGQFVADVCYYYGDHIPNIAALKQSDPAGVLPGFDYDVISEEVLLRGLAVDPRGRLVLPSGMEYRVLVLPDHRVLSLGALRKVSQLVDAGATVIGLKPDRAVSLVGGESGTAEFRSLTDTLWGTGEEPGRVRRVGKGRIVAGREARSFLLRDGVRPDFEPATADDARLDFIHRRVATVTKSGDQAFAEIYFVAHQSPVEVRDDGIFRIAGRLPEIWDPVTGRIRAATDFRQSEGRTVVPLRLPPFGSTFVLFRETISVDEAGTGSQNFPVSAPLAELTGPWTVRFDPEWGGPRETIFEQLIDWTAHSSRGVKYYSGTATYEKTFDLPRGKAGGKDRIYLDVGDVREMARVRLNGRDCGIAWTPPFEVDITDAVRPAGNRLEIEVVNQWTNRLVGDANLPPGERKTRTNITRITKDSPLLPSGLLGPVTVRVVRLEQKK